MSADFILSLCNNIVVPGWLLLVFLPRWKWTGRNLHWDHPLHPRACLCWIVSFAIWQHAGRWWIRFSQ
jgi:hypothetical protein